MKTPLLLVLAASLVPPALGADVLLSVAETSGVARERGIVTSGVPFPAGALRDPTAVRLRAEDGSPLAVQTDALARWPDGSVRWLLVDFQTPLAAGQKKKLTLSTSATGATPIPGGTLKVSHTPSRTTIDTGPLRIELDPKAFDPFGAVWLDRNSDGAFGGNERVTRAAGGFFVRNSQGQRFESANAPAEIVIEESGPLRASVRITGRHAADGGALFSYVVRLHAFRGQPYVRCSYTFINDSQDAVMASIAELGLAVQLAPEAGAKPRAALGGHPGVQGRVFQRDETAYDLDGRSGGKRAPGWAVTSGDVAGVAVGVREFWQQWPKSVEARDGSLVLGLCPSFADGLYDGKSLAEENKLYYALRRGVHTFKIGVAKTHELTAHFFAGAAPYETLGAHFRAADQPLLATCEPAYIDSTRVAGPLPPADSKKFFGYDAWIDRALLDHLARREREREYGMMNYGDWYGERQVNWGNLEYDLQRGLFLQYFRTGDRRYFDRAAQAARHHIDVDVIHAVNPHVKNPYGAPPRVGEIWLHSLNHTGGYFLDAPLPVERSYQMGHSANYGHIWVSGDLDYYYLTGDRRARDVALLVADMMSSAMTSKVSTHIRTLGWPMILVLSAYEATGNPKYLEAAQRNWVALKQSLDPKRGWVVKLASDHCLHPQGSTRQERDTKYKDQRCEGNVPFMEGLTLAGLARYHQITGDPEVLQAISVGVEQMIRECWQEDLKTFRYTACPLSSKTGYSLFMLCAEAMAYDVQHTRNREHQRVFTEAFQASTAKGGGGGFGKTFAQIMFFAPHALAALEDRKTP